MGAWLRRQLQRLIVLPFGPDTIDEHEKALADIPEAVLTAAVDYALKTRQRFPVPSELRQDADKVAPLAVLDVPLPVRERELEQPFTVTIPHVGTVVSVTREWRYYCEDCSDTGWFSWWCGAAVSGRKPWQLFGKCERAQTHGPHEYVTHCQCWESNPALLRKRDAQRKYAEQQPPRRAA